MADTGRHLVTDAPKIVVVQPIPDGLPPASHILAVLIGLDILVNALLGGRAYQTMSSRCEESIRSGGWASRVPWPRWWLRHCAGSDYLTEV